MFKLAQSTVSIKFSHSTNINLASTMGQVGFPGGASGKEPACQCRRKRCRFDPWVGKIPWRRAWQSTPVFLPGEAHGQRSLAGYSSWGSKESDRLKLEQLRWRLSGRRAGRCRTAHMETIKQMSRQVSRGSAVEYQADEQAVSRGSAGHSQAEEQAGVARCSWRI